MAAKKNNLTHVEVKDYVSPALQKQDEGGGAAAATGNNMMAMIMAKRNQMKKVEEEQQQQPYPSLHQDKIIHWFNHQSLWHHHPRQHQDKASL